MLASRTRALIAIPLILADGSPNLFVFAHELAYGSAQVRNHCIEFHGGTHRRNLRLPVSILGRNEAAQRLPIADYRQRPTPFQLALQILTKLAYADLFSFHFVYSIPFASQLAPPPLSAH